ncbi:MAG: TetR family transcriptional regulator, partial [bacterium]|nr:TetR family transcriptional regulator [bacterium]
IGPFTELYWSTLHGVATLTRGARLSTEAAAVRLDLLNGLFGAS